MRHGKTEAGDRRVKQERAITSLYLYFLLHKTIKTGIEKARVENLFNPHVLRAIP